VKKSVKKIKNYWREKWPKDKGKDEFFEITIGKINYEVLQGVYKNESINEYDKEND